MELVQKRNERILEYCRSVSGASISFEEYTEECVEVVNNISIYIVIDLCDYLLIRLIVRKREGKLKFPRNSKRKEWKRMVDKFELLKCHLLSSVLVFPSYL